MKAKLCLLTVYYLLLNTAVFCKQNLAHTAQKYIYFFHNKFFELNDSNAIHPEYGKVEYTKIIESFKSDGFIVFSEKRLANTDAKIYAKEQAKHIDSLIKTGVKPSNITVIGTSKGGYIAQYVSTYLANPAINFVFIGCFNKADLTEFPDIQFCGNILYIYEKTDAFASSAVARKTTSKLKINHYKEIALNTGLKHGFLFKALAVWMEPSKMWASQNYKLTKVKKRN
jgi:Dienelactone hydrolase family